MSLNSVTTTLFHFFVRKNVFYCKNIQYVYNFYATDMNVCRDVFRTQSKIYDGEFFQKPQKPFILDAQLRSKFVTAFLFLQLMKTHFGLRKKL